jgi:hypothetical protein
LIRNSSKFLFFNTLNRLSVKKFSISDSLTLMIVELETTVLFCISVKRENLLVFFFKFSGRIELQIAMSIVKKTIFLLLLNVFILSLQNCTYLITRPPQKPKAGLLDNPALLALILLVESNNCSAERNRFWVRDLTRSDQASYCQQFVLKASGSHYLFYEEEGLNSSLDYNQIANSYNNIIYPKLLEAAGPPSDVDNDQKVTILTLDIKDGGSSTTGFIAGFVDPRNFEIDDGRSRVRSNQKEVLYMDGKELVTKKNNTPSSVPDPYLATLAHEMQHLIRYQYGRGSDPTWIDEGTSEVMSDITGFGPQKDRLECFVGADNSICKPQGIQGISPFVWAGTIQNYSYSYAFIRYLYYASLVSTNTDNTNRTKFISNSIKGIGGVRANSIIDLMKVFKTTDQYIASSTSLSDEALFQYLMISFFALTNKDYTPTLNDILINTTSTDLTTFTNNFPLTPSTTYYPVYSYGSPLTPMSLKFINTNNSSSGNSISPGVVHLNNSAYTGSGVNGAAIIKLSGNRHLILNPNNSGNAISPSIQLNLDEDVHEELHLHPESNCITPYLLNDEQAHPRRIRKFLF